MKLLVFAIFLLAMVQAASAIIYEEQVFSNKLTSSGSYTTSNGENFTITLVGDYINIWISGSSVIVKNNTCDTSGLYDICLLINEFSHYDHNGSERIVNKRDVTITTRVAKLNLTREITKSEFWIGDEAEVMMRVQNMGDRPAIASFLDNFSDSFKAGIPLNCDLKENAVVWKGEIGANQVVTCSYSIRAAKAGTFTSSATASYSNGVSDVAETDGKSLVVKDFPLKLSSNISGNVLKLGNEVTAKFEMNASENMTVKSLRISLPEGLRLLGWSGIGRLDDGTLEYEGSLYTGEGREFNITFSAEKTGNFSIAEATRLVLTDNGTSQNFGRKIEAEVSADELYTRIVESNFSSGAKKLNIFVVNPSDIDFYNVKLSIDASLPLQNKEAFFSKVSLLGHQEFSESFEAGPGTYPVTTMLTYNSLYGEKFSVTKIENVTIYGEAEQAEIPQAEEESTKEEDAVPAEQAEEDAPKTGLKIKKGNFSTAAAVFATMIVLIIAAAVIAMSSRRKKLDDEF